jgi:hypothetical protein
MRVKKYLELQQVFIAHFVDLDQIYKKVIEGNLPGSLLWDIRSTQRSKKGPK